VESLFFMLIKINRIFQSQIRYAGHNKWSKIRHVKGSNDSARGKLFSKISRQIKAGVQAMNGETDTSLNHYLAAALHAAKVAQMPKATVQDAVKRALSKKEQPDSKMVRYEGLGPGGAAVLIEALVSKPTKTNADIKLIFKKFLGSPGPVEYLFERRGHVTIKPGNSTFDVEKMMEWIIASEDDIVEDFRDNQCENSLELFCALDRVYELQQKCLDQGYEVVEWGKGYIPMERIEIPTDQQQKFAIFLEQLEQQDEVVHVYHNAL
jgi:YebC/PmpR family DNA-binding regulatory protein